MRVELFAKDAASVASAARQMFDVGATNINIPNKGRDLTPSAMVRAVRAVLTDEEMARTCCHYSLKFCQGGRGRDGQAQTLARLEAFLQEAAQLGIRETLLVSGSGKRAFDSVACLRALKMPQGAAPAVSIGVAFNPYFPERPDRMRERARLRQKLGTGKVSAVWLQLGSDPGLLEEALVFLAELKRAQPDRLAGRLRVYGSVFLPSRRLLAQMKFRP